jgi:hypothetical protein
MQGIAEPNGLVMAESTRKLVGNLFERRQRPARHDVLWPDPVGVGIEVGEIAGPNIDGSDAEARFARIDPIEVDQTLQRALEFACII